MPHKKKSDQDLQERILFLQNRIAELETKSISGKSSSQKTSTAKNPKISPLEPTENKCTPGEIMNLQASRDDEELYAKLMAIIPDPVIRTDTEGKILFVNEIAMNKSGYSRKELIGNHVFSFLDPKDLPRAMDYMKSMFTRSHGPVEYRFISKSGALMHIEVNGEVLRNSDGSPCGTILVCRDITERKNAERSLRESEQRLASIINSLPDPALVIDCHGVIIAWNRALEILSGLKAENMVGMGNYEYAVPFYGCRRPTLVDLVLNPNLELEKHYHGFYRHGDSIFGEAQMPKSGDREMYLWGSATALRDSEDNIIGAIETLRDITDRKQAENTLKEWEERYRLLAEASFEGIAITDRGVFVDANQQMLDMLGYTHAEIVGKPVSDVIAPESVELVMKNILRGYEKPYENHLKRKDGSCFPVLSQARMMLWGGRQYRVTVLRDITDLKKAEEERKHLEEQVYHSHKLEALGTLAGGIAHDFNNLLMAIQGYASLMLLECNPNDKHYDRLKNIEKHVKSGADLTKQLLGFARGGKYESRPTDINDLLAQNSEMFGRTKREISILCRFAEDIWTVEVDRGQMDQVFLNLYINAWQAMPAGGNLYIDTQNIFLDNRFTKPYDLPPGRYVKISVTDTGFGMDEKTLQRVFEPFFTTKAVSRGSGLGLASAYGIIRNHGGTITVYSQKGYGTTFNIYLPASDKAKEKELSSQAQTERGSETILVVDDDPANIDVISQILTTLGYTVITACGGLQAVEIYRDRKDIDLVILDMIMPGLSGGETFDQIKRMNHAVKVILSSGYSATGQAKAILDRGVKAFIQKPFTTADFSLKIREALAK